MTPHDPLETQLRTRHTPPASPDLAERIIRAAHQRPQRIPFWLQFKELLALPLLPNPAYSLAAMLLIGITLGLNLPTNTNTQSTIDTAQQTVWPDEEGIL